MNLVENITSEYIQTHALEFSRGFAVLTLIYEQAVQMWKMNVVYTRAGDEEPQPPIYGVKLALSTTHIKHRNWPFDFTVIDTTNNGMDPYRADDFEAGRCELYFITPEEMIQVRGVDVQ
ncbi:hypothetical protein VPGG_00023 [Vibrio phage VBM1]|uniref:hypothetical protein n=1 Tax=Vibrio phage VBM1 TaxID=754074 RepID=UPI0002C05D59|nr:hypothetical protein VPGG_00023 [Vibrio phage VBM1]AGH07340.1 hypothetical protein VPGG_00023 [Vibrio phage VBM1]